jgi:hypothetical protein
LYHPNSNTFTVRGAKKIAGQNHLHSDLIQDGHVLLITACFHGIKRFVAPPDRSGKRKRSKANLVVESLNEIELRVGFTSLHSSIVAGTDCGPIRTSSRNAKIVPQPMSLFTRAEHRKGTARGHGVSNSIAKDPLTRTTTKAPKIDSALKRKDWWTYVTGNATKSLRES